MDALNLERVELIVLDVARDAKKRSILDIPETRRDWWELFRRGVCLSRSSAASALRTLIGHSLSS